MITAGLFDHEFVVHALVAGSAIAAASGFAGYFLVLRSQVFTGDALTHVAFTGALGALAFGVDARIGLYAATVAFAVLFGSLGPRGRANDVVIGAVFVWVLGLGVLFLSIFARSRSTANGAGGVDALFGSIFGLDTQAVIVAVVVGVACCVALALMARPLLFASLDEGVAAARGIRVGALGIGFLVIVGLTAAEAAQAVGSLLLLALVAAPAATAQRLTARPYRAMVVSVALAVVELWAGVLMSEAVPSLPAGVAITGVVSGVYVLVIAAQGLVASRNFRSADSRAVRSFASSTPVKH